MTGGFRPPIDVHYTWRLRGRLQDTEMTQAIVSPEELRAFAQKLKQFNTMLSDQATMLANQLDTLSATWRAT